MGVNPLRIIAIVLGFVALIFILQSTARRKGDLQQQNAHAVLHSASGLEDFQFSTTTDEAGTSSSARNIGTTKTTKKKPKPQQQWNLDGNSNEAALLPINQEDWDRIDNQECISGPTRGEDSLPEWQHRLPYAVICGAMKAGTEALWYYLKQHPHVIAAANNKNKEQHFFDKKFEKFATAGGIQQDAAQRAYGAIYKKQLMRDSQQAFQEDAKLISLDNTPRYLFWSDRIPKRIFCVAPWVKMLVLLRNPVERAYSHYVYTLTENFSSKPTTMLKESFEDWIEHDMRQLTNSGVLENSADMQAWKRYLRLMPDQTYAILGKGLYVIQLRHWFDAMDEVNKPRNDMLILESQRFKTHTPEGYAQVLAFLGLPEHPLGDAQAKHSGHYSTSIKKETQKQLQDFFRPFNEELYTLLEWDPVWD